MAGTSYTRQSTFDDGDVVTAALFNNEYNKLLNAFVYASTGTTGHQHDGGAGEGGNIEIIGDQDFLNKLVVDTSNNRWGFFVQVSSSAVEQIRIQDGAIVPVTDNDIDLGTSSLEFKDGYFDGTIHVDTLDVDANATIAGTLGVTGIATVGGLTVGSAALNEVELEILDGATVTTAELNILDGVTSTAAELNILDGVTSTAAELNLLDGVTATTTELNLIDGVTSTTAELNILDGVTSTAAELNTLDGVTAVVGELNALDIGSTAIGTAVASKAVILDSNKDYTGIRNLTIAGDLTISGDDLIMGTNTAGMLLVADGTNFNPTAVSSLSEISTVANDDVFIAIDTSGGGLKRLTRSAIVSGLAASSALSNVVEDTTPQLGGNLDVNGKDLITLSNATIDLAPHGTGTVVVRGNTNSGAIVLNCESNSHGQKIYGQPHSAQVTNTLMLPAGADSTLLSRVSIDTLTNKTLTSPKINEDVAVTSTATEINILDGVTSTTAELNILDGVTSTAAELNILDGVTSTAAELNILDGVTSTATELNLLDGVTSTTAELNILDGVTSTFTELNLLDGVTSTTAELNALDGITAVVGELNALDIGSTAVGTAVASKAVILDSNKDYTGIRNLTISGELDAATLDISGAVDIAGNSVLASVDVTALATAATFEPDGDTAAGDNAAIGYTAAEGLILTGQGSTGDVTIKNDADALVAHVPTGTTGVNFAGDVIVPDGDLILGSTAVTSTAAELNILDGVTSTAAELNILDGVTSTAAELNILDGVTSTAAELNILDGVTATATELNQVDGVVVKTAGKETIWVPSSAMSPTTSNGCAALAVVETTSGRPDMVVLDFDKDSDEFAQFSVAFPKSYNLGTVTFQVFWAGIAATSDCDWSVDAVAMNDNQTIDVAFGTAVVVTDNAQGAVEELLVSAESGALTIAGTPADNDLCFFRIGRDVSGDAMDGDARLLGIKIFFTTDLANDG